MRTKDAYNASNDKNRDRKLGWKGKQEDRHRVEFGMEIRTEQKVRSKLDSYKMWTQAFGIHPVTMDVVLNLWKFEHSGEAVL